MPSEYNPQLVENMSAKFRRLNNPAHAMADAVGMLQMFPGLRGLWVNTVSGSGNWQDVSGNGLHLTNNNTTRFGSVSGLPILAAFNGTNQYFNRASEAAFQIAGTESYILTQGLTVGGWFWFDNTASATEAMIYNLNSTDRNYLLQRRDTGIVRFGIYNTNTEYNADSLGTIGEDSWYFIAGRFTPSTELKIWTNSDSNVNTTSIPASIDTDAAAFTIGASAVPGSYMDGRVSLPFLCAAAVPDIFMDTYFQMTAPLFGVTV